MKTTTATFFALVASAATAAPVQLEARQSSLGGCAVGLVNSPCNGGVGNEAVRLNNLLGNARAQEEEKRDVEKRQAGGCMLGLNNACNGPQWDFDPSNDGNTGIGAFGSEEERDLVKRAEEERDVAERDPALLQTLALLGGGAALWDAFDSNEKRDVEERQSGLCSISAGGPCNGLPASPWAGRLPPVQTVQEEKRDVAERDPAIWHTLALLGGGAALWDALDSNKRRDVVERAVQERQACLSSPDSCTWRYFSPDLSVH